MPESNIPSRFYNWKWKCKIQKQKFFEWVAPEVRRLVKSAE